MISVSDREAQPWEMPTPDPRLNTVWAALESLTDPEIPVLSLREMGILREVRKVREAPSEPAKRPQGYAQPDIEVVITPTYSGCPAMDQIENDVRQRLSDLGIRAKLVVQLAPPWTTDWMSPSAHSKLREYGIAAPLGDAPVALVPGTSTHEATGVNSDSALSRNPTPRPKPVTIARYAARSQAEPSVPCPRCGSIDTTETSHFGSTACKALYRCLACMEPFDYFKPH